MTRITLKLNAQLYALLIVLTVPLRMQAETATANPQEAQEQKQSTVVLTKEQKEQQAVALLTDFVNPTKRNANKTFAQYAKQLITLLEGSPQFASFRDSLSKMQDCKDATLLSLFFSQQQHKLPASITAVFKSKKPAELMNVLRSRLK